MKNSNDTIGNRTRDLLVCNAVPQPTAPPAACTLIYLNIIQEHLKQFSLTPVLIVFLGFCEHPNEHSAVCTFPLYRIPKIKAEGFRNWVCFGLQSEVVQPNLLGSLETAGESFWSVRQLSVSQQ